MIISLEHSNTDSLNESYKFCPLVPLPLCSLAAICSPDCENWYKGGVAIPGSAQKLAFFFGETPGLDLDKV